MKFVCIHGGGWRSLKDPTQKNDGPKRGDLVTKTKESATNGVLYYSFKEWGHTDFSYQADCFIPINEQPEEKEEMKEVEFAEFKKDAPISAN
jgi:hypothetical protein